MPTEAGKTKARQAAWGLMTMRNWTIGDLASHAGADPATVGDFLAGKRWPRVGTLGKIEDALEMTRGTLAALGEEQSIPGESPSPASTLGAATDSELTSELTYRIEKLRREVAEMRRRIEADREAVERERRRQERRVDFLGSINEDSAEDLQQIAHEWMTLAYESQEGAGSWKADHQSAWEALCDTIDALVWAEDNDLVVVERISYPDHDYSHGWPQGDYLGLGNWEPHPRGIVELPVAGFDAPDDADVVIDFVQRRLLREMNEVQAVALDSPTSDANRAEAELDAQCGEVVDFPGPPPADDDDQAEPPGWAKKLSAREVADEPKGTGEHH